MSQTLKTFALLAALTALLITVGYILGGESGAYVFFLISLGMNFFSFWFSDKIALTMSGAQPLSREQAPQLYDQVSELATGMGIPAPRLYLIPSAQANAFATGRSPSNSAVALTEGIWRSLTSDELRGVLAHELAHIQHRDVLLSTVAASISGMISALANISLWSRDERGRNPLVSLLVLFLAPISATILQLAISRSREYAADAAAAKYTGRPRDLANALIKIDSIAKQIPMQINPAVASLFIANPLGVLDGLQSLFSTHPPIAERVRLLEDMA